jgi:hypothetical protein
MATKQQEREALAKIRKIVSGLGEQSYIGTAFDGCWEDAEFNIDSDAAFSLKGRLELEQAEHAETKQKLSEAAIEAADAVAIKAEALARLAETEEARQDLDRRLSESAATAAGEIVRQNGLLKEAEQNIAARDTEILRLKAKLYDLMVEEEFECTCDPKKNEGCSNKNCKGRC